MFFVLLGALAISFVGCDPGPSPHPTPPDGRPPAARLETGAYLVRVNAVDTVACDRPSALLDLEDLEGETLDAEFLADGKGAVMDIEGVVLFGAQREGVVTLAGRVPYGDAEVDHERPDDEDADPVTGTEGDADADTGVVSEEEGCGFRMREDADTGRPEEDCGGGRPDRPDRPEPPPEPAMVLGVTMNLVVQDEGRARGQLGLDDGACFVGFGVEVVPDRGERDEPVYETDDDETSRDEGDADGEDAGRPA